MNHLPELIDSHCHLHTLDLTDWGGDITNVLSLAESAGVTLMLCVCIEPDDLPALYALADRYPAISISVGIHPNTDLSSEWTAEQLLTHAKHPACLAMGETGLDYYRTTTDEARFKQQRRFRTHIQAAIVASKPLIIHTRQAQEDTLRIMKEEQAGVIGGVMHCFSEDWSVAKQALDLNFYISFSGIVTFKNAQILKEVAKKVPLNRILIETDAPYLAPVPYRGKQNHPAWVRHVAIALGELRQEPYEVIAAETTANFYRCFQSGISR